MELVHRTVELVTYNSTWCELLNNHIECGLIDTCVTVHFALNTINLHGRSVVEPRQWPYFVWVIYCKKVHQNGKLKSFKLQMNRSRLALDDARYILLRFTIFEWNRELVPSPIFETNKRFMLNCTHCNQSYWLQYIQDRTSFADAFNVRCWWATTA
jgi:hypothetical protein